MEKHDERENASWVDSRLSSLNPDEGWQPNVTAGLARLNGRRRHPVSASNGWVWLAMLAASACFLFLALPTSRVLAHRCLECTVEAWQALAQPSATKITLPPESERRLAPDFVLKDAEGQEIRLSGLTGKVVLVNFWATWCHGCQTEIPWFIEFQKKYHGRGLAIVGVSMDEDGWKSVRPWIAGKGVNYPIVIGSQSLGKEYGLEGMPLTALVDREGKIADIHSGVVNKAAEQRAIETLLAQGPGGSDD